MRYTVKGTVIRSENAAKPMGSASAEVIRWIGEQPNVSQALDYGCGKLRYTSYLAEKSDSIELVDSAEQLEREQVIDGRRTTVRQYARATWPGCRVYDLKAFWRGASARYELVLCANVLSAIPSTTIRTRSLNAIRESLARNGRLLVVNQYANSDFERMRAQPHCQDHLDGWVSISDKGRSSYYGLLASSKTEKLLEEHGFTILSSRAHRGCSYVEAKRDRSSSKNAVTRSKGI